MSPEVWSQFGVIEPSTRSLAVGLNETAAPEGPVASAVTSSAPEIIGAVVSCTVTWNDPLAVPSCDSHSTVVSPSGNVEPESGEQFAGFPSWSVAENVKTAPPGPVASRVWSGGRLSVGSALAEAPRPRTTASATRVARNARLPIVSRPPA